MNTSTNLRQFMLFAYCSLLCGCSPSEIESSISGNTPGSGEMGGDLVEMSISLTDTPVYRGDAPESRSASADSSTLDRKVLVAEWVKPKRFSLSRTGEDNGGIGLAAMELFEEPGTTVASPANTRSLMGLHRYFRVIAFRKVGSSYVYQTAADYTVNQGAPHVLKQGSLIVPTGQTYRFVAYSFNNETPLEALPDIYTWGSTEISIPDLSNDFLTFDSGDMQVTGNNNKLPITFTHQLCKLTVKINYGKSTTFTNCTGVYIKEGGDSSTWTVGESVINPNTNNTAKFDIADNTTTSTRLVPFAAARPITVHFGTLTVDGDDFDNTDISSTQGVQLLPGKSYTMTVRFQEKFGIKVPADQINLGAATCTAADKADLAKLTWAEGNLKSTGSSNYVWTTAEDYGYYYTFYSTYTGDKTTNDTDPCSKLNADTYGTGWRTPSKNEFDKLVRCSDKTLINGGMWFMNSSTGLFLPAAGWRGNIGSGTTATDGAGTDGKYWSSDVPNSVFGGFLFFYSDDARVNYNGYEYGFSVRCVKGEKQ